MRTTNEQRMNKERTVKRTKGEQVIEQGFDVLINFY